MRRAIVIAMALGCFLVEGKAFAEPEFRDGWHIVLPQLRSNTLADKQAELVSSAALSWPDGRQAIVTSTWSRSTPSGTTS